MRADLYPGETPGIEHYLFALRRRWPVLLVCVALAAALGAAFVDSRPHTFGASTKVLVGSSPTDVSRTPDLKTESDVVLSTVVAREALGRIGGTDIDLALDSVTVAFPSESSVLDIVANDSDPFRARDLSKGFADAYIAQRVAAAQRYHAVSAAALVTERDKLWAQSDADDLERPRLSAALVALGLSAENATESARLRQRISDLDAQRTMRTQRLVQISNDLADLDRQRINLPVAAQVLRAATVPTKALGTPDAVVMAGFVFGGVIAGIIVCFVLWRRDGSASGTQRILDAIGAPVFGEVPMRKRQLVSSLAAPGLSTTPATSTSDPPMALGTYEAYLRTCRLLTRALAETGGRAVVVTSGDSARDKSLIALNLAMTFARLGDSTVLVCADLLGHGPEQLLGRTCAPGVSDVLAGGVPLDVQSDPTTANLYVLGVGERASEARDLLDTDAMRDVLDALTDKFDMVVVDSSPVLLSADAVALGAMVGVAVLVTGQTRRALRVGARAHDDLERGGCAVLGVVATQH